MNTIKALIWLALMANFSTSQASLITVRVEDAGVFNWEPIQKDAPGFGSHGPVSLNWDPYNDFFTELLAYDRGYSGGAAAFCWYGENCALRLSVTAKDTKLYLQSFDLSYYGYGNNVDYNVINLSTNTSIRTASPWVSGSTSSLITVDASSDIGFLILFGPDGFNGGINNITYDYHTALPPVNTPLPATAALFATGLAGLRGLTRRSKRRIASTAASRLTAAV